MPEIILSDTDRLDWALKTFKRQVLKAGIRRRLGRTSHSDVAQNVSRYVTRLRRSRA